MKKCSSSVLFLVLSMATFGQTKGRVVDADTHQPIAFASVYYFLQGKQSGVIAENTGEFFISQKAIDSLVVSATDYETKTIAKPKQIVDVFLSRRKTQMAEVVVGNAENPALRIVRKAIAMKAVNDFENTDYESRVYVKNKFENKYAFSNNTPDSIKKKLTEKANGDVNFITEMVILEKRIGERSKAELIASKTSGLKNPIISQFFYVAFPHSLNFYKNDVTVFNVSDQGKMMNTSYVSPLDNAALTRYKFKLEQTIVEGGDTIYIIHFEPKKGAKFNALFGEMHISSKNFALKNIVVQPDESVLMQFKIHQTYQFISNKSFPQNFDASLRFMNMKLPYGVVLQLNVLMNTSLQNVNLSPAKEKNNFNLEQFGTNKDSLQLSEMIIATARPDTLTQIEARSYRLIDSATEKKSVDKLAEALPKIMKARIPMGIVDIDLLKIYQENKIEKSRLGLGLYTNNHFSPKISLGGYAGYGTNDKTWKYGGEIQQIFSVANESYFKLKYDYDLLPMGKYAKDKYQILGNNNYLNNFLATKFDKTKITAAELNHRFTNTLMFGLSYRNLQLSSLYPNFYDYSVMDKVQTNEVKLSAQLAFKRRAVRFLDELMVVQLGNPIINIGVTKGKWLEKSMPYTKVEVNSSYTHFSNKFGATNLSVAAGFLDEELPINLLFSGYGSRGERLGFVIPNSFQTMDMNEFVSSKYTNFFFTHNFGKLLFDTRSKYSRPELSIAQNIGFAKMTNKHVFANEFKQMKKPYLESGLMLNNILRTKWLGIAYLGVGAGVYHRYGANALATFHDNTAYKIAISFSMN